MKSTPQEAKCKSTADEETKTNPLWFKEEEKEETVRRERKTLDREKSGRTRVREDHEKKSERESGASQQQRIHGQEVLRRGWLARPSHQTPTTSLPCCCCCWEKPDHSAHIHTHSAYSRMLAQPKIYLHTL